MNQFLTFVRVDTVSRSRIGFCVSLRPRDNLQLDLVLLRHRVVRHGDGILGQGLAEVVLRGSARAIRCFLILMEVLLGGALSHIILVLHILDEAGGPLLRRGSSLHKPSASVGKVQEVFEDWIVVKLYL